MILDVKRVEKKYMTDPVHARIIKQRLAVYMKEDEHNGRDGYVVRSVYFDSLYNKDYFQKEDGVDDRKKIRLRIYDPDADFAKLELKEKRNGSQRKRSLVLTREEAESLIKGKYQFLKENKDPLSQNLDLIMQMDVYRPKCMVEYDRFAYYVPDNNTRITFDSNLRGSESSFSLFDKNARLYPLAKPDEITLEVKYDGFLISNIKKALSYKTGIQTSFSKYGRSRMLLRQGGGM